MTTYSVPAAVIGPTVTERAIAHFQERIASSDRYIVSVDQYVAFRRDGFLVVKNLLNQAEVHELLTHTNDLMQGRLPEQEASLETDGFGVPIMGTTEQVLKAPPAHLSPEEKANTWLRIHMLHRQLALHERYLLHPRVLDVLEALIGPEILALQTMLFLKGPGKPGQGFHQDSYYIPTHPDTLCGAWMAIDDVDEENGCVYFTPGSQNEPVYPPADGYGFGDDQLKGIHFVRGVSDTDDRNNDLAKIAEKKHGVTGRGVNETPAIMRAGDVAFFGGHVLHRSFTNESKARFRRSFVGHYCNARSYTSWGADGPHDDPARTAVVDAATGSSNGSHILARGNTHLPFATPRFNTPCAALLPAEMRPSPRCGPASMMGMPSGKIAPAAHATEPHPTGPTDKK